MVFATLHRQSGHHTLPMVILVGPYGPLGEYLAFYLTISHVFLSRGFEMWYIYWFSDQSADHQTKSINHGSAFTMRIRIQEEKFSNKNRKNARKLVMIFKIKFAQALLFLLLSNLLCVFFNYRNLFKRLFFTNF